MHTTLYGKKDRHDIHFVTEILLKVALNTINQSINQSIGKKFLIVPIETMHYLAMASVLFHNDNLI